MAVNHDRLTLAEVEQALAPDLPPEDVKAVTGLLGAYLKRRYEKDANETTMLAYASYIVNDYDYDTDPTDKNGQGEHPTTVDEWAMLNTRMRAGDYLKKEIPTGSDGVLDEIVRTYSACMVVADLAHRGGQGWKHYQEDLDTIEHCGIDEAAILAELNRRLSDCGVDRTFVTVREATIATKTFTGEVLVGLAKSGGTIDDIARELREKGVPLERDGLEPMKIEGEW